MAYTLGKFESLLQALKDRLDAYTANGKSLSDIKEIRIGSRYDSAGLDKMPFIQMNIVNYREDTLTMAQSAGQKTGTMTIEFKLLASKIGDSTGHYSNNVLFDSAGKGVLAYFQWLLDALTKETDSTLNPTLGKQLDLLPDYSFSIDEKAEFVELILQADFALRFQMGTLGGTIS